MLKGVQRRVLRGVDAARPTVYRGRPFQIEAAIAFGGDLPADESARVIRFANRVPLLFQQSAVQFELQGRRRDAVEELRAAAAARRPSRRAARR
jgi:DNA topoisomerase VI subunit B